MEAKLLVVGGKVNKQTVTLKLPTVVGRSREAGLTVPHPMISRRHCEIFEVDGLLMIRDLGSLNGTVVEGRRVSETPLRPNDEFTIGPFTFRAVYEYDGDLEAVPAAKIIEQQEAESEQEVSRFSVDDVTPYDPQTVGAGADEPIPPFLFMEKADDHATGEQVPDFSTWAQTDTQEDAAEAVEEEGVAEFEGLEEEEEEAEPEPTPPPPPPSPREKPPAREAGAESVEEPAVAREPPAAEVTQDSPKPSPAEGHDPAKAIEGEKAEALPNSFAAVNPDEKQPAPAETKDEELNKFLKGLQ